MKKSAGCKFSRLLKNSFYRQAVQKVPDARPQEPRRPQRTKKVREDLRGTENEVDGLFQQPVSPPAETA